MNEKNIRLFNTWLATGVLSTTERYRAANVEVLEEALKIRHSFAVKEAMKSLSLKTNFLMNMDIQSEKLQLIEWLARLNNTTILKRFITLKKETEKDWWDQLSTKEKSEIEEGLAQADRGEVVPHKEVMAKYKKWR